MRILIISSVFYPRNSPRASRATELAKYFAKEGHDVVAYACTGRYDYHEFESKSGVKVKNIPDRHFSKLESDGSGHENHLDKVLKKLFGRLLEWPGLELAFKMKYILQKESQVDLLITVAIPYPIHWGVAKAKAKLGDIFPKVWISDCGDPYMGNTVGPKKPSYFQKIENFWAETTDYITIPIEEARNAYPAFAKDKIKIIPQGFDFESTPIEHYSKNAIPTFAFAGATYAGYRDPSEFLEYLTALDYKFKFIVYTPPNSIFHKYKPLLKNKLEIRSYVTRSQLIKELSKMDFLININNNSAAQSPSKLIDYAITKRPILSVSSNFKESRQFDSFMKADFSEKEIIDLYQYDIRNIGRQFLDLYAQKNENCNL